MIFQIKHLALALIVLSTLGCIKTDLENKDTPSSLAEVQNAIASAWGEADPMTMTVGDFIFQETEQRLNSGIEPFYVLQEGISISKKEELAEEYQFTYLYQHREYKNGVEGALSTREDTRSVAKATNLSGLNLQKKPEINLMADDNHMRLGFEKIYSLLYACEQSESIDKYCKEKLKVDSCTITCSNLKSTETKVAVPASIAQKPNCGGFTNCQYTEKSVAFDWQIEFKTGDSIETQRVNYWFSVSPDLPFFTRLTRYCSRQLFPIQGTQLLVDTCTNQKNFATGQP